MPFSGTIGRAVYAVLVAVIVFVVLLILAALLRSVDGEVATIVSRFAPILAILSGLAYFFVGHFGRN